MQTPLNRVPLLTVSPLSWKLEMCDRRVPQIPKGIQDFLESIDVLADSPIADADRSPGIRFTFPRERVKSFKQQTVWSFLVQETDLTFEVIKNDYFDVTGEKDSQLLPKHLRSDWQGILSRRGWNGASDLDGTSEAGLESDSKRSLPYWTPSGAGTDTATLFQRIGELIDALCRV